MTVPSIVAGHTTQADTVNATTRTINVPTYSAGNVVLLAVVTDAASGTISSPQFADFVFQDRPIKTSGGSTVALASVMWKVASGSEGSTYTIDTSASERVGAICFAVSGAGGIHAATETNGDSGTATVPAIITSVADCLRISIVGADGTTQTTPHGTATNHTKLGEAWATSSGAVSAHYKTIPSATTDSAETSTLAASFRWIGFSIALAPMPGSITIAPSTASAATAAPGPAVILGSLTLTPSAALAIGANACYCEGWVLLPLTLPGQQGFTMVAHGWVELGGQVIDMEGAAALSYFASSRRVHSQVDPTALPLHAHDKQADRRHQRTMHKALAHLLTLSPTWATIVAAADPPIV